MALYLPFKVVIQLFLDHDVLAGEPPPGDKVAKTHSS